jgi:putative aldouronate transport system substrate-binding protein
MKKQIRTLAAALLAVCTLSACGAETGTAPSAQAGGTVGAAVDLSMYLVGDPARDYDEMMAQLNEKAKADLNATVKVSWIGWGDFGTKYPLVLASGEPIDLIYAATWTNFYSEVAKGAFMALDELAPKYMPKSYGEITPSALQQASVGGHLYGIPATWYGLDMMGYIVRGDLMKSYGMDTINNMDDYGRFLQNVVDKNPELDPTGFMSTSDGLDTYYAYMKGYMTLNYPLFIDLYADKPTVVNLYDDPGLLDHYKKMKDWGDKGYWPKSVLSNKDERMFAEGKAASRLHNMDSWKSTWIEHPEWEAQFFMGKRQSYRTAAMQDGMAVPAAAKNPERALMFLEKLRQDQAYYNLMTYGIEGKHYSVTEDNFIESLDPAGFTPEAYCSWGFKEPKFYLRVKGLPPNYDDMLAQLETMVIDNPYIIFSPDYEPVKNERATVESVRQQYGLPLAYGYVDPEEGFKTLVEKMEAAGLRTLQAELQKQLEAFAAGLK